MSKIDRILQQWKADQGPVNPLLLGWRRTIHSYEKNDFTLWMSDYSSNMDVMGPHADDVFNGEIHNQGQFRQLVLQLKVDKYEQFDLRREY